MISQNELESRRLKLFSLMENNSVMVLFSGVEKVSSADETYPFEVNRNFYYLTGIDQPDSVLLLVKADGEAKEFLFVSPYDPTKEKWYGKRLTVKEASELSGITNVLLNNAFEAKVEGALNPSMQQFGEIKVVYIDQDNEIKIADHTSTKEYSHRIKSRFEHLAIKDAFPLVTTLRLRKSPQEIEELRKAIEATRQGILSIMSELEGGMKEYEMADLFLHVVNDATGYQGLAFNTIMASGPHATILHYPKPMGTIRDYDLLLMDLGARVNYYNADVSRTIPVSGKYSPLQRQLYNIVLGCNKMIANMAKPGVTINQLQEAARDYLASECFSAGLIERKSEIDKYYFHGVSHHIGLDTHDPYLAPDSKEGKNIPLAKGMVISDEPGLYMADRGIGIRIEDDLLITDIGCEVLTDSIPKDPDEIERILASRKKKK